MENINYETIVGIVGAIIVLGLAISRITATKKDDEFFGKAKAFFDKITKK